MMNQSSDYQLIAKPAGPRCNMDCSYCFYLEKEQLFDKTQGLMSDEVLETYITSQFSETESPEVSFIWQGGEPTLLGLDYFKKIAALQQQHGRVKKIRNAIQTNGLLLDDAWCEFLSEHNFLVGISIDGPQAINDQYRLDNGGKSTFDKVIQAVELLKKHRVEFNTLTTVHQGNADAPLAVYHFLKELGSQYLQFIPIVEKASEAEVNYRSMVGSEHKIRHPERDVLSPSKWSRGVASDWSVKPGQYGEFLNTIFDEWVQADVGRIFVQNFDLALEAWSGKLSSLCVFNETCGHDPVIEHNGDLFSCDHFVSPEYKLGNILRDGLRPTLESSKQHQFGQDKRDSLTQKCRDCEYRFACHGGCPKDRFVDIGEVGVLQNYLCEDYLSYFKHIDPYMKFMANELRHRRAPAKVMQWSQQAPQMDMRQT